jgi:hypothetical protein
VFSAFEFIPQVKSFNVDSRAEEVALQAAIKVGSSVIISPGILSYLLHCCCLSRLYCCVITAVGLHCEQAQERFMSYRCGILPFSCPLFRTEGNRSLLLRWRLAAGCVLVPGLSVDTPKEDDGVSGCVCPFASKTNKITHKTKKPLPPPFGPTHTRMRLHLFRHRLRTKREKYNQGQRVHCRLIQNRSIRSHYRVTCKDQFPNQRKNNVRTVAAEQVAKGKARRPAAPNKAKQIPVPVPTLVAAVETSNRKLLLLQEREVVLIRHIAPDRRVAVVARARSRTRQSLFDREHGTTQPH